MMINCKESSIRSSELRDRQIKGIRKLELWYHLIICKFCRIYNKQINLLGKFSRLMGEASCCPEGSEADVLDAKLSDDAKERIKKNLVSS